MNTQELLVALAGHYRRPGETRDGEILLTEPAAPGSSRRIDLLRVGLWRSRGFGIDAHELKVSRSDWQRELDDPAKAEAWWPYCHRFWIVAPSTDVVDPVSLPDGWGLMIPGRARRFKTVRAATSKQPKVSLPLLVELVRCADNARLAGIDALRQAHRDELWRAREQAREQAAVITLDQGTRTRLELMEQLEATLGVTLDQWPGRSTGRARPAQVGQAMVEAVQDRLAVERMRVHAEDTIRSCVRTLQRLTEIELPPRLGDGEAQG